MSAEPVPLEWKSAADVGTRPQSEPINILLVDDRMSNLLSLEAMLRRPDYNLVLARSGREALRQVLSQDFVVILLDVAMPDLDGFETATIIKQRDRSRFIPIIFVTASVYEMEQVFRGYSVGAVDYLRKPLDPHAVVAKVSVFVELHQERRRNERQAKLLQEAERLLRERAEAALRDSEAVYLATFEEAPVGIGHATPEGRWTKVNRKLSEIVGLADGLVGKRVSEIVGDADAEHFERTIARLRVGGAPLLYTGEHQLRTSRPCVWGGLTLSAVRDDAGDVRRFIVVVADISERKAVEMERARLVQELRQGVAARDDFLSVAAHELRTPITPLRLQTSGLLRELSRTGKGVPGWEALERRLLTIEKAGARLEGVIDKLLDASRMSVGKLALELGEVDLAELVGECVEQSSDDAERAGATITVTARDVVRGLWDRVRLGQVVTNLLSNAIKYGEGKPIVVTLTRDDAKAYVRVRDHGVGIPPEAQEAIFERFERLAPVRHHGGFGLGLWIVRQIVTAHGGTVTVSSRSGEGAEFTVALPFEAPRVERAEVRS